MEAWKEHYTKEILENKYCNSNEGDSNALYVTKNLKCDVYTINALEPYEERYLLGIFKTRDEAYNYFKKNWDEFSQRMDTDIENFSWGFWIDGYKFTDLSSRINTIA